LVTRDSGLGGGFRRLRDDVDPAPALVELDRSLDQREDRPVAAHSHVLALQAVRDEG